MLCFRAKIKVRYTLLLFSFFAFSFYGIARVRTFLHHTVAKETNNDVAPDVIRRSLTARWHDSRELLNKISKTRNKFLAGERTPPKWDSGVDGQLVIEEDNWPPTKSDPVTQKDLIANENEIIENSDIDIPDSWDENSLIDDKNEAELRETTVPNPEEDFGGNNYDDADVQDSKKQNTYNKDFMDDIEAQSREAYPGIEESRQNNHKKDDPTQNFQLNLKLDTRHDDEQPQYDNGDVHAETIEEYGENEEEDEPEIAEDAEEYDDNKPDENNQGIATEKIPENRNTNQKFNKTIFQPNDSKIKYYISENLESFTRSQINGSRIANFGRANDFPMSPEDAVRKYGDDLPSWEKYEIFHYPKIYYLGLGANKTRVQQNISNNFGFDFDAGTEKEGHYKVVIGDHIGYRYEILKYVDAGTFGAVVLARDWSNPIARDVALKIMHLDEEEKYFLREVRMMEYLEKYASNHNYFSRMIATFQFRNHWCIVMELLGHAVDRHYLGHPVRDPHILRQFSSDIIKAMYYLNELNIVHGDLKPDNIMYIYGKNNESKGQLLKVADFGISCIPGSEDYHCPEYYIQTRYYRAPEVILSLPITPQCDMFSVGVILAEFWLGVPPFFGETEADQLAAMMEVIGLPPTYMIAKSRRKKIYAKAICYTTENGFHRKPYRKPLTKVLNGMDPMLFDLIARCLEWDPKVRITPEKALRHPFFTGSYPAVGLPPPLLIKRLFGEV
uniref:dual specificity tyrosine-phosphorylation-regulated kinase 4-like n=1 Tax=Styela clava TaxID=7725 RepID=UPI001939901F|nr:dual specificity tyrosine-phosphorylation-regulated kinase 4-like [Styela clava]